MRFLSRSAKLAVIATLSMVVVGCGGALGGGSDGDSDETIKIGLLIPETGTYAPLGKEMRRAAELYMKQHDDKIGGKKAEPGGSHYDGFQAPGHEPGGIASVGAPSRNRQW